MGAQVRQAWLEASESRPRKKWFDVLSWCHARACVDPVCWLSTWTFQMFKARLRDQINEPFDWWEEGPVVWALLERLHFSKGFYSANKQAALSTVLPGGSLSAATAGLWEQLWRGTCFWLQAARMAGEIRRWCEKIEGQEYFKKKLLRQVGSLVCWGDWVSCLGALLGVFSAF